MKINKNRFRAIACVLLLFGLSQNVSAQTINIGLLTEGSTSQAINNITFFVAEHPEYTWDNVSSNAALNAMSVADLIATYDILVVPWQISSTADLDWDSRILPFIEAGGGVLWEDPTNVGDGDLSTSGVGLTSSSSIYPGITGDEISLVPPFDSNGAIGWYHIHFGITGHDGDWFPYSTDIDGGIHGVGGEFGAGRMLIGVSDNLYHPLMSNTDAASVGAYNLLINEIFWLRTGSVDGIVRVHIPVPTLSQWSFILLFVLLAFVGITRLRRTRN